MAATTISSIAEPLSDRESEILHLVALGKTNLEIAGTLFLSPETVKWHNKRSFSKLGASNRTEAVAIAQANGLLNKEQAHRPEARRAVASRLPAELSSFVGREQESKQILTLLDRARLITLTGPGGVGKTRLSLHVAATAAARVSDVAFVSMAAVSDPKQVARKLVQELGIIGRAGSEVAVLKRYLRDRHMLLVLDNFEHLLPAAPLVSELLAAAPHLRIIATSREALHLTGEHEFTVPPLPIPGPAQESAAALTSVASVTLFVQRAQAATPGFTLTEENATTIGAICARLEGLPLAIELAAARIRVFAPEQLLARLDSRLDLLTGGPRDLPARQGTLRDTIAWSYDLLDRGEQQLLRRLSVFVGGCSLAAVEAVCGTGLRIDVVDGLYSLLTKSLLLTTEAAGAEPRFFMLETIREFAQEQLVHSGNMDALRNEHLAYFRDLLVAMEPNFRRHGQLKLLEHVDIEFANLQSAFEWALASGDVASAAQLISAADYYLNYSDKITEGYRWLNDLNPRLDLVPERLLPRLLLTASRICGYNGDHLRGTRYSQQGLALARRLGDRWMEAWLTAELALNLGEQGAEQHSEAIRLGEEAVVIFRETGDSPGMAVGLNVLGELYRAIGEYDRARQAYSDAIGICRANGEIFREAVVLTNLSFAAYNQGRYEQARGFARDHLRRMHEISLEKPCDCLGLAVLAGPLARLGQPEKAARLLAASETLMEEMGATLQPIDAEEIDKYHANVRDQLSQAALEAAWSDGQAMTLEQAIAYALDEPDGRDQRSAAGK